MNRFLKIAITPVSPFVGEAEAISAILNGGWYAVHLRHPEATIDEMRQIIRQIPSNLHSRLRLHDHFTLAEEFSIGGLHLNRRSPQAPASFSGTLSRSCHSIAEVAESNDVDYVTLSPIFDSISKSGYKSAFSPADLSFLKEKHNTLVIALGGITPKNALIAKRLGFDGIAVLGSLFGTHPSGEGVAKRLKLFDINK